MMLVDRIISAELPGKYRKRKQKEGDKSAI